MKTLSKSSLFQIFAIGGIVGIVAGLVHLYSGLTSEFTTIIIGDMAINMLFGVLSLIVAWLLRQGKTAVIYVVIIWIAAGVFYAFAVGRGLNFFVIIAGAFVLWQLNGLRKQGELTGNGSSGAL